MLISLDKLPEIGVLEPYITIFGPKIIHIGGYMLPASCPRYPNHICALYNIAFFAPKNAIIALKLAHILTSFH